MSNDEHGLHYRGFDARVYYDEDEGLVLGHVATTRGGIDFRCTSLSAVERELHKAVDAFLSRHPDAKPLETRH